jgi:hypothetical protein
MMHHGPGLAASPPVRNNLEVGRRGILFLRFSAVGGQSLYEAAVRVLLFEQRRSAGIHPLVEQQTLPQTAAPNRCYGYGCTRPRRSVPISRQGFTDAFVHTTALARTNPRRGALAPARDFRIVRDSGTIAKGSGRSHLWFSDNTGICVEIANARLPASPNHLGKRITRRGAAERDSFLWDTQFN